MDSHDADALLVGVMEAQIILTLGAVVLGLGSMGLLIVRLTNSRLKGLGWLGAAFAAGALGSGLLLAGHYSRILSVPVADLLVLLGFVLLDVALRELLERESLFPALGVVLLGFQALADIFHMAGHGGPHFRITVACCLVAVQCASTAWVLWCHGREKVHAPAVFCAALLLAFAAFNVVRATVEGASLLPRPELYRSLELLTFALYIAVALGLAFGLFWMTTAVLSAGLEQMASTDPLTRILNRRVFLMWCEKELTRSLRDGRPFSVLMLDLDHFKSINDSFGHHVGDEAICAAVEKMQDSIRGIDVLARWGGEEFAVLLPNASSEAALIVAERMRANIEKIHLKVPTVGSGPVRSLRLTASIGMATYKVSDDVLSVLHRADRGMYLAKGAGRNRVLCTS
jgi:diguanylate cyclase (GGDEF)-like protein